MVRVRSVIHFMTALCAIVVFGNLLELCTVLAYVCRPQYRAIIVIEGFAIMLSIACAVFARFRDSTLVSICNLDKKEWGLALIAAILHGVAAGLVSSVRTGLGNISAVSFSWICLMMSTVVALLAFTTENGPGESFFFVSRFPEVGQRVEDWLPKDNNEDGDVEGGVVNNRNQNRRGDRNGVRNENENRNESGNQKTRDPSSEIVIDVADPLPSRPKRKSQPEDAIKNKHAVAAEPCQRIGRVNASINVQVQDDDSESDIVDVGDERSQRRTSKRGQCVDFISTHHQGEVNLGSSSGGRVHARGDQLEQGTQPEGPSSMRGKKKEKRSGRNNVDGDDIKADVRAGRGSGLGARLAAIAAENEAAARRQGRPTQTASRQQNNDGGDSVREPKTNTGAPLLFSRNVSQEHEIVERI